MENHILGIKEVVEHNAKKPARVLIKSCSFKWRKQLPNRYCQEFEESKSLNIFKKFWKATWEEKKMFVIGMVSTVLTKAYTTVLGILSRKAKTYKYFLKHEKFKNLYKCISSCFKWMLLNWVW